MGKKKDNTRYDTQAATTTGLAVTEASKIKTPYSDAYAAEALRRLPLFNRGDEAATQGHEPFNPLTSYLARQQRRGLDGNSALAAPEANSNYVAGMQKETEGRLSEMFSTARGEARERARSYWTGGGFGAEGNQVAAGQARAGIYNQSAQNYGQLYHTRESTRRQPFWQQFLLAGMGAAGQAMTGMGGRSSSTGGDQHT